MVRKLWKHEYLAWLRVLPLIYGITLVIAAMLRLVLAFENESVYYMIVLVSAIVMFVIALIVTIAAGTVFGIQRFYKNLFTGEGYLTHTLPVTPAAHLWVKLLTAASFDLLSLLVCLLAGMIATAGEVFTEVCKAISYLTGHIPADMIPHISGWTAEFIALLVVGILNSHLLYYLCICLGQLARKNRVLAAVGVYFGFYMLTQILSTVFMVGFTVAVETTGFLEDIILLMTEHPEATMHVIMGGAFVLTAGISLVFYLICHRIIRKKLNLE